MSSRIICGDSREELKGLEGASVDLVCTDPPYALVSGGHKEGKQHSGGFMGKSWDKALPDPAIWRECLRVLKPGGFALVMSGARSDCLWRLCRDLEEAGFDIALSPIYWIYRQGFPKALNISADFDRAAFREWLKAKCPGEDLDDEDAEVELLPDAPEEVRRLLCG